eukprot:825704-Amphidinium_carterae.1
MGKPTFETKVSAGPIVARLRVTNWSSCCSTGIHWGHPLPPHPPRMKKRLSDHKFCLFKFCPWSSPIAPDQEDVKFWQGERQRLQLQGQPLEDQVRSLCVSCGPLWAQPKGSVSKFVSHGYAMKRGWIMQ